jgi:hypothetical protein
MKTFFQLSMIAAVLMGMAAGAWAQNTRIIFQWNDCDAVDMSWALVNVATNDTVASGGNYFCYVQLNETLELAPGNYSLMVYNPDELGTGRGVFMMLVCGEVWYTQVHPFPGVNGLLFTVADDIACPCADTGNALPADIDADGVVGVTDLMVLISNYGVTNN